MQIISLFGLTCIWMFLSNWIFNFLIANVFTCLCLIWCPAFICYLSKKTRVDKLINWTKLLIPGFISLIWHRGAKWDFPPKKTCQEAADWIWRRPQSDLTSNIPRSDSAARSSYVTRRIYIFLHRFRGQLHVFWSQGRHQNENQLLRSWNSSGCKIMMRNDCR